MKQITRIIIDFNQIENILKQKSISIKNLIYSYDKKDYMNILNFLIKNNNPLFFINQNYNIKNISEFYYNLNDFIILNKKDATGIVSGSDLKKISNYSPSNAYDKLIENERVNFLNKKEINNYVNVLISNNKKISDFLFEKIKKEFFKDSDYNEMQILDKISKEYPSMNVISLMKKYEIFSSILKKINSFNKKNKIKFDFLFLDIIEDLFIDINEKLKSNEITVNNKNMDFIDDYFLILLEYFKNKGIKKNKIIDEIKKYPIFYNFLLERDKNFNIVKILFKKNEILEKRILNKKHDSAVTYLKNIFDYYLIIKNVPKKDIIQKLKEEFKDIFDLIVNNGQFSILLSKIEPSIEYIPYINNLNLNYLIIENNLIELKKLLLKYFDLLKKEKKDFDDILNDYKNLVEIFNESDELAKTFINIFPYNTLSEKSIKIIEDKYDIIYYQYLINLNINLNVYDEFNEIKKYPKVLKMIFNDIKKIFDFFKKHESEIPFRIIELEEKIDNNFFATLYLYFYRNKLSERLEKLVAENKKTYEIYNNFLKNKNNFFKKYDSYIDFYVEIDNLDSADFIPNEEDQNYLQINDEY